MPGTDLAALAADAYIYGFPLVYDLSTVERCTTAGMGPLPGAPFNTFAHSTRFADPGAKFVSVSNDTLHSVAQLDLSAGPLLLRVPDTGGRYHVLQFVDAWSNTFAYVGRRATGTAAATWLIEPPGWSGHTFSGVPVISSPTAVATIVGRFACAGPDDPGHSEDVSRVAELQERLTLRPLEPDGTAPSGLPLPDPEVSGPLRFFEQLRVWMAAFPPAAPEVAYQEAFLPLGLLTTTGPSPYRDPEPELLRALEKGAAAGKERIEAASGPGHGVRGHGDPAYDELDYEDADDYPDPGARAAFTVPGDGPGAGGAGAAGVTGAGDPEGVAAGVAAVVDAARAAVRGWEMTLHLSDYNLDHFGPGTIDSPLWRIPDRAAAHLTRAVAARTALWGNHAYEAAYAHTFTDATGARLTGERAYVLRFDSPPPVKAFWSVTMYDADEYLLVSNPIGRYAIGDRTPGLRYGDDGSLTISLRHDAPDDPAERANWLPTPAGPFRPVLRLYEPCDEVLDDTWRPPPIVPVT
ncbi:DUF1254 domain-containing protein [Streptantibioticus parmotrematis]|uniref:DUF1254 domain-containing protein n=1 Tax=Streptantibioticus parmotrematis TaxID=2873249 RepID=UPI0033D01C7E